jgi:AcrR family transcriptional regulator
MTGTVGRRIRGLDAEQRRQQRREQLLDAALDLFAATGYHNTSIEQICQAAYVGTKSFYEVFDGREACYLALLQRTTERISGRMVDALRAAPPGDASAVPALITAFAHALVDDPRLARVTFGQAAGISPAVERQRRTNRRWAAAFLESVWRQYGITDPATDHHRVAVGTIGGMFDLVADWLLDSDPTAPAAVTALAADLTTFHQVISTGLSRA